MATNPTDGTLIERIRLSSPCGPVHAPGQGILCIGVPSMKGFPPLLLVADEEGNPGTSSTNGMQALLGWLDRKWAGLFALREAIVFQKDSTGCFDHVLVQWVPQAPCVDWAPVSFPAATPRSEAAFMALGGPAARQALKALALGAGK